MRGAHTLEEGEDRYDAGWANVDGELVLPDRELLDVLGQAAHHPGPVAVHGLGLGGVLVGRVDDGGLEGADGVAGRLPGVGGVPRDGDDLLLRRRGEAPDRRAIVDLGRRLRRLQSRRQTSASANPAGHFRGCELSMRGAQLVAGGEVGCSSLSAMRREYFWGWRDG